VFEKSGVSLNRVKCVYKGGVHSGRGVTCVPLYEGLNVRYSDE